MSPKPDLKEIGSTGLRRTGGTVYEEFLVSLRGRRGAKTVDLTSRPSREAANRLYQRLGFKQRETNVYRYDL